RDQAKRLITSQAPRDLLTLDQRQPKRTTLPSARTPPASPRNERPKRRVPTTEMLCDPLDRHARLAHVPDRLLLLHGEPHHRNTSQPTTPHARQSGLALRSPVEHTAVRG